VKVLLGLSFSAIRLANGNLYDELEHRELVNDSDIGAAIVYQPQAHLVQICGLCRDTINTKLDDLEYEFGLIEKRPKSSSHSRRINGQFGRTLILLHTDGLISTSGVPDPDGGDKNRAEISGTDSPPHDHDVGVFSSTNIDMDKQQKNIHDHASTGPSETIVADVLSTFANSLGNAYTYTDRDHEHVRDLINDGYPPTRIKTMIPEIVARALQLGVKIRSFGYCVPPIRDHRPVPDSPGDTRAVDNVDPYLRGDVSRNLDALRAFGVNTRIPDAQEVAALSHVTPALITAWGRRLRQRDDVRNLPGLLLYTLTANEDFPEIDDPKVPDDGPTPDSLSDQPTLPEDIRLALCEIGWVGPADIIIEKYEQDSEFVKAWLDHTLRTRRRLENPAGYFRTALKGMNLPEKREYALYNSSLDSITQNLHSDSDPEPETQEPKPTPEPEPEPKPLTPEAKLWEKVKENLSWTMADLTFRQWIEPLTCVGTNTEGELVLLAFNGYQVEWVHNRLETLINRTIKRILEGEESMGFRLMLQEEIEEKGVGF
jgi:hypothetical protein